MGEATGVCVRALHVVQVAGGKTRRDLRTLCGSRLFKPLGVGFVL